MGAIGRWMAAAALVVATPALADVKAGVDAWARGDYRRAVEEWRGPAVAGDADAQFNMGQAYKLGRGVPVDLGMAEEWYRKAATQGHPQGEDNYGLTLFQNNKRDRALPWLEKSAARGEARAQYVLGTMYFNADAVARDWVKAYALMTRATAKGLPQAISTLAQMDRYIALKERQQATELARRMESDEARPPLAQLADAPVPRARPKPGTISPVVPTDIPASTASGDFVGTRPPRPAAMPTPKPSATATTGWRVQLGAFRDTGNANALFARLQRGPLAGKQSYLVKSGPVTRLLAGPYATQPDATRACAAIKATGNPCLTTRG